MTSPIPGGTIAALRESAVPLTGTPDDFHILVRRVGNSPLVLIGEASHGTHEFYRIRAQITKRLIAEKGFNAVAIEGDWPDAFRVNRFIRGTGTDPDATLALAGFRRFPQWMWRNADVLDFVGWLRAHLFGGVEKNVRSRFAALHHRRGVDGRSEEPRQAGHAEAVVDALDRR